jgi:hypothetical protein
MKRIVLAASIIAATLLGLTAAESSAPVADVVPAVAEAPEADALGISTSSCPASNITVSNPYPVVVGRTKFCYASTANSYQYVNYTIGCRNYQGGTFYISGSASLINQQRTGTIYLDCRRGWSGSTWTGYAYTSWS